MQDLDLQSVELWEGGVLAALFLASLFGFLQILAFKNVWRKFYERKVELGDILSGRKVREPTTESLEDPAHWRAAIARYKERLARVIETIEEPNLDFRRDIFFGFVAFFGLSFVLSSVLLILSVHFSGGRLATALAFLRENWLGTFFPFAPPEAALTTDNRLVQGAVWYHEKISALLWPSVGALVYQLVTVPTLVDGRASDFRKHLDLADDRLRDALLARRKTGRTTASAALARMLGGRSRGRREDAYGVSAASLRS